MKLHRSKFNQTALSAAANRLATDAPFASAARHPSIRPNLEGEWGTRKVRDYLDLATDGDAKFAQDCDAYEQCIGNGNLRPGYHYQLLDYFVDTPTVRHLNTLIGKYSTTPELRRNIALVGPKGSGKTATQNVWLARYHTELEERRVFWVRCDCNRLYRHWQRPKHVATEQGQVVSVTIVEYFKLKLVYVIAKHAVQAQSGLKQAIWQAFSGSTYSEPQGREGLTTVEVSIHDKFSQFARDIRHKEQLHRHSEPHFQYIDDFILIDPQSRHRSKRQWLALADRVLGILQERDIWVLNILDGVDNIHISKRDSAPLYREMMRQTGEFLLFKPGPKTLKLAALRERTYRDAREAQEMSADRPEHDDTFHLPHETPPAGEILRLRYEHFKATHTPRTPSFGPILEAVCALASSDHPTRFRENHRTSLHNRLTLVRQVYYRNLQRNGGRLPEKEELQALARSMSHRNFLLNDRFFLDTAADFCEIDQESGACARNLFYVGSEFSRPSCVNTWHGLCGTRILQALAQNPELDEVRLGEFLNAAFAYSTEHINEQVRWFRSVGMIDSTVRAGNVLLELSNAGRFHLDESYTEVDMLYYAGLDCQLPDALVRRGLVRGHCNRLGSPSGYRVAASATALTFIVFLAKVAVVESTRAVDALKSLPFAFDPALPIASEAGFAKLLSSFERLGPASSVEEREISSVLHTLGFDVMSEH